MQLVSDLSANGYKGITTYKIYSKNDIVTIVEQKKVIDSEKKDILNFYKDEYNSMYKKYNKTYGGYTYDVNVEGEVAVKCYN